MVTRSLLLPLLVLALSLALAPAQENSRGILPASAADGVKDVKIPDPRTAVLQTLRNRGGFTVLVRLLETLGFSGELSRESNRVTLLAPTNNAFANLARRLYRADVVINASDTDAIVSNLTAGLQRLTVITELEKPADVLNYHQVGEAYTYEQLVAMRDVPTLAKENLLFVDEVIVDGDSKSGNATVSESNIFNLNGWIHVVDQVLLPYDLDTVLDDVDVIMSPSATPSVTPTPSVSASMTASPGSSVSPSPSLTPVAASDEDSGDDTLPEASGEATDDPTASVSPTPSSSDDDDGVCFPAHATVTLPSGASLRMDALTGEHTIRHGEHPAALSRVFLFSHRVTRRGVTHVFSKLSTACGPAITLTPSHYLYANGRLTRAGAVRVGDSLRTVKGPCAVVKVARVEAEGLYAPHTMHGDVVVDGVVASGYSAAVAPGVASVLLAPVRWAARMTGVREPLGAALYGGADWALAALPRGRDFY